jgi:hypothetical protein
MEALPYAKARQKISPTSAVGAHHAEVGDEEEGTKSLAASPKQAIPSSELHNHSHRKPKHRHPHWRRAKPRGRLRTIYPIYSRTLIPWLPSHSGRRGREPTESLAAALSPFRDRKL